MKIQAQAFVPPRFNNFSAALFIPELTLSTILGVSAVVSSVLEARLKLISVFLHPNLSSLEQHRLFVSNPTQSAHCAIRGSSVASALSFIQPVLQMFIKPCLVGGGCGGGGLKLKHIK